MTRWTVAVAVLGLATSAFAQQSITPPPPPPPSSDAPAASSPPAGEGVTLSEQQQAKTKRYGRFAAGPGGPLFVFTEVITGMVGGGLLGGSGSGNDSTGTYLGVLGGGVILGTIAALYQFYVPVGMGIAALTALGSASGFLLGSGIWDVASMSQGAGAAIALALSQVAVAGVLIATHAVDDVSYDDVALIGMVTGYAAALAFLVADAANSNSNINYSAVLFAPAVGMGLGALLATQIHIPSSRILKLVALPLGVGLVLFTIGSIVEGGPQHALGPVTAIIGIVATFALTFIFTQPDSAVPAGPPPARASEGKGFLQDWALAPVIAPAGPANHAVAVGPGFTGRF